MSIHNVLSTYYGDPYKKILLDCLECSKASDPWTIIHTQNQESQIIPTSELVNMKIYVKNDVIIRQTIPTNYKCPHKFFQKLF